MNEDIQINNLLEDVQNLIEETMLAWDEEARNEMEAQWVQVANSYPEKQQELISFGLKVVAARRYDQNDLNAVRPAYFRNREDLNGQDLPNLLDIILFWRLGHKISGITDIDVTAMAERIEDEIVELLNQDKIDFQVVDKKEDTLNQDFIAEDDTIEVSSLAELTETRLIEYLLNDKLNTTSNYP